MLGSELGPYEIIEEIGRGGMATVYRARQPNMDRFVAIKIIHKAVATESTSLDRFQREAKLIARLEHPHILPVYDYNGMHDPPYIVMRYMPTGTLKDILERDQPQFAETGFLLRQIASALDYAHRQGVVHRDIKPSNIMIDAEGNAFLTDFGIARMVEGTEGLTASGMAVGTPRYMAPEQGMGLHVDGRVDIYALGVMLFEMLTGQTPYQAETPMGVILKHINEPPPPVSTHNPDIAPPVDQIIQRAMAKEPEDRYQTATKMADALLAEIGSAATSTPKHLQEVAAQTIADLERVRAEAAAATRARQEQEATVRHAEEAEPTLAEQGGRPWYKSWPVLAGIVAVSIVLALVAASLGGSDDGGDDGNAGRDDDVIAAPDDAGAAPAAGGPDGAVEARTCPEIAQGGLANLAQHCATVEAGSICLAHPGVEAVLRQDGVFAAPGDRVPLAAVESVQAAGLDEAAGSWGLVLIQAAPEVTALLVGEAQLTPADDKLGTFTFRTDAASSACAELSPPALVLHVMPGETATFEANGVTIAAESTLVLRAPPDADLTVAVLAGQAMVTAQGDTQTIQAGQLSRVPVDTAGLPVGAPGVPEPIDDDTLAAMTRPVQALNPQFDPAAMVTPTPRPTTPTASPLPPTPDATATTPPTATEPPPTDCQRADVNDDGRVDILDMRKFSAVLETDPADRAPGDYDLNQDGAVNILDLRFVSTNLDQVCN
jgi:tRNA A-37 threonylcarbamoyl transferase component Bud32